jgi:hypothetical protein
VSRPQNGQPARLPVVVNAADLRSLADRLEERAATSTERPDRDLLTAARLCRHAAVTWVGRTTVSIP